MQSKIDKPATPDQVWKLLITKFFNEFLLVFKPDLLKDIIPERTEFLEKELISLTGKQKTAIVDIKYVSVFHSFIVRVLTLHIYFTF